MFPRRVDVHPSVVDFVASVRVEVERLSHKDVRQRRRAIRHLFELNDPFALSGFLQFLDSDDQWFVDQSIEAIRRWDKGESKELLERVSNHKSSQIRLLSLEICGRYDDVSLILSNLRIDSEPEIQKRAWITSLKQYPDTQFKEIFVEGLNSKFVNVRKTVIESAKKRGMDEIIIRGLDDSAPIVISKSIEALSSESLEIERIRDFLSHSSSLVRSTAFRRLHSANQLSIEDTKTILSIHSTETMEAIIDVFSGTLDWASEEILHSLKEVPSDSLIPRLIRNSPKDEVDIVRAELLLGNCNDIRKMRYLEDLIGRDFGNETLSAVVKISEEIDEEPVKSTAIEVLRDRAMLGKGGNSE